MFNRSRAAGAGGITILIALVIAAFSIFRYFGSTQVNPTTGEMQRVALDPKQEIALGLQAAPQLIQQFGGESRNARGQEIIDRIGSRIVQNSKAEDSPYRFEFHLLDDDKTINAFALPGGQVFLTEALARKMKTEGELAGVIGHEIGHVVVMEVLGEASKGRKAPEFFSTHPNPENRISRIEQAIEEVFPNGTPSGLKR